MAEFCLDCFNRLNDTKLTDKDVVLEEDFCEGCSQIKPCVIAIEKKPKTLLDWLSIFGI